MSTKFNLEAKIKAALRKLSMQWPAIGEARRRAKVSPGTYRCEHCELEFSKLDVNHIHPVVDPEDGFLSFDIYIARLFCHADDLEAICKDCHKKVTNEQRSRR